MTEEISVEEKARSQGWVPKDEYHGPEENWKSAEEFVEVGEKISAIQAERNDKLLHEIKSMKGDFQNQINDLKQLQAQEIEAARKGAYDRAMRELQAKQIEAVEEGDVDKFKDIQREMEAVKKPEPVKQVPQQPQIPEEQQNAYVDWAAKNDWYGKDERMTRYADSFGRDIANRFDPKDFTGFYNAITNEIKQTFPDNFKDQTTSKVPDVESPNGYSGTKTKGKYKFSDLPPDAQEVCNRQIKEGWGMTKEKYVKYYFGE